MTADAASRTPPPPPRAGRPWLALALLVACGEPPGEHHEPATDLPRATFPVVSERLDPVPPPIFAGPVDDGELARGERWSVDLEVQPGFTYRVLLEHRGPAPALWSAPTPEDAFAPVQVVSSADGRVEALISGDTRQLRLELRAFRGDLGEARLTVRRWALSGAAPEPPRPGELSRLTVGHETRTGWVVDPDQPLGLPLGLPPHATRLALSTAPLPGTLGDAGELRVQLVAEDAAAVELLRVAVGRPSRDALQADRQPPWRRHSVDVAAWAGRDVRLTLSVGDREGSAGAAVSVPEVLCERGATRPNLIVVSIDTLRPDHLTPYGGAETRSPELQALAARGVVFEQARSVSAYTLPAHATLFSGMHPLGHGAVHPGHALDVERVPLLADLLRRQGYATRAFTGGGYLSPDYGFSHGFAAYSVLDPVRPWSQAEREWRRGEPGLLEAAERARRAGDWDAALAWITDRRELPFFAFLHTFTVHDYRPETRDRAPAGAPAEGQGVVPLRTHIDQLEQPYDQEELAQLDALYDGAVTTVDRRLGELLDTLDALELTDRTIVVVTSDHGETLGERVAGKGPHVGHAFGLWHEQVAVPLVLTAPGLAPQRRPELVTLLDVAPTLLGLLGLPPHPSMQGVSLVPWLQGRPDAAPPSPALYDLHSPSNRSRALEQDGLKLVVGDPEARVTMPVAAPARLFDRRRDPGERRDLAPAQPGAVIRLSQRLEQLAERYATGAGGTAEVQLSPETRQALIELGYIER